MWKLTIYFSDGSTVADLQGDAIDSLKKVINDNTRKPPDVINIIALDEGYTINTQHVKFMHWERIK